MILRMAWASLVNRRLAAALTVASVALSVFLLLGVETVRNGAREGFASTISGTDLIVGARSGGVNLLLYAVFHIGNATNNVTWESYEDVANRPEVAWIVPISLGDKPSRLPGDGHEPGLFRALRLRPRPTPRLRRGARPSTTSTTPSSAPAWPTRSATRSATRSCWPMGPAASRSRTTPTSRSASPASSRRPERPWTAPSRSAWRPSRRSTWTGRAAPRPRRDARISAEEARSADLSPRAVTAAFVGLTSPIAALSLQRWINDYREEPLSAILPGVALSELWSVVGAAETALLVVSALVVVTALIGLVATILTGLEARRREIAILRSVGAGPRDVLALLMIEAASLTLAGIVLGTGLLYAALLALRPAIETSTGLAIAMGPPGPRELGLLAAVFAGGLLAALVPAVRAYRMSLAGGLTVRV